MEGLPPDTTDGRKAMKTFIESQNRIAAHDGAETYDPVQAAQQLLERSQYSAARPVNCASDAEVLEARRLLGMPENS